MHALCVHEEQDEKKALYLMVMLFVRGDPDETWPKYLKHIRSVIKLSNSLLRYQLNQCSQHAELLASLFFFFFFTYSWPKIQQV